MSKQIPEGATHTSAGMFYRRQGTPWSLWGGEQKWIETACAPEWLNAAAKPIDGVSQWQGPEDGLPPVGTVCDWQASSQHEWKRVTVIAYNGIDVWLHPVGIVGSPSGFRATRTPEQVKAEQRESAVKAAMDDTYTLGIGARAKRILIERLYDAGYRKFEIVDERP